MTTVSDCSDTIAEELLFARIAEELASRSWSAIPEALPVSLSKALLTQLQESGQMGFLLAGTGRNNAHSLRLDVRRDEIHWIEGHSEAERQWLGWSDRLRLYLNRRLFLGLFSFESHFAHYGPGAFYKKHLDAFKGNPLKDKTNRVVSVVSYFNPDWSPDDGGALILYAENGLEKILEVLPKLGTLVVFLSEDVPHEVLPAQRDRYSIAGWYRVNSSGHDLVDPPN